MNFRLDIWDRNGIKKDEVSDFVDDLSSVISVNSFGTLTFILPENHKVLAYLAEDYRVELYYRYSGRSWTRFFGGLVTTIQNEKQLAGKTEIICYGYELFLTRRVIAYYAETSNKTKFIGQKSETILKSLVQYNITSDATVANGRFRDGTSYPANIISVEADGAGGLTRNFYCAHELLLTAMQNICKIGGGDFSISRIDDNEFQVKWHENQLGTDRRTSIIFSLGRANMANPRYTKDIFPEKTVAIVGGQGEKSARDIFVKTASSLSTYNDVEFFTDATDVEYGDTTGLEDAGVRKLEETKAVESFSFDVLQAESTRFGVDYYLGDIVTAINPYNNLSIIQKVKSVGLELRQNGEYRFDVELELFDG